MIGKSIALGRRARLYFTQPHVLILLGMIGFLSVLVLIPLVKMVSESLTWSVSDQRLVRGIVPGDFTLFHWHRVLISPLRRAMFVKPLINSIITSLGASLVALIIGLSLAWLVTRTDIPGSKFIGLFGIVPFLVPSWVLANAWLVFFKNQAIGGYPGILASITGVQPPDWIAYGALPTIICLGIHYSSFSFLLASAALDTIDVQLEESGEVLGASRYYILRRVTFPIILPAIISAFVLTFSRALGNFGTPYFLGAPIGYRTMATQLYSNVMNGMYGDAWVIGILLISFSSILVYFSGQINKASKRFQTISGKSSMRRRTSLGRSKWVIFSIVLIFITLVMVGPTILFGWQSLMLRAGDYSIHNVTTHFWIGKSDPSIAEGESGILRQPIILRALANTVKLGIFSALFASILGVLLGYGIIKGKGSWLAKIADQLSFIPYIMPAIAVGAAYVAMFGHSWGPIPALYGTFALLVLGMMVKNLPFASRTGISTMVQIGQELEEAGAVAGGSWLYCFRRIIAPLAAGGFVAGLIMSVVIAMKDLDLVVLLASPGTEVLSTAAKALSEQGVPQLGSATIFLQLICLYVTVFLITKILRVDISRGLRL